jgi:hypothetical protein
MIQGGGDIAEKNLRNVTIFSKNTSCANIAEFAENAEIV